MDAEQSDLKQYADRLEFACRAQLKRIAELEAENERLKSNLGAHQTLRLIYSDPDAPRSDRIKAAAASLPHEVPKLMPERAPLELKAEPEPISLLEQAERRMKKAEANAGRDIEVGPNGEVTFLPRPGERDGNG